MQEMSWGTLIADAAEIAAFGKARIDGKVSYLATIRRSGKPRIHPVTAIVGDDRCFIFAEPASSKVKDLEKNKCGIFASNKEDVFAEALLSALDTDYQPSDCVNYVKSKYDIDIVSNNFIRSF